jgi:DNA polymerase III alpha subunit
MDAQAAETLTPLFVRPCPPSPVYQVRLREEFDLIDRNRFTRVFLQVRTILALTPDVPHIIRGSAGSSLVCYLLGITEINPVQHGLELARFMNSARTDLPDIDMDFPYNRRDEVYQRIDAAFPRQMARISNHIVWRTKTALRRACREAGIPAAALPRRFKLERVVPDPQERDAIWRRANELIGQTRTTSLHCGGIVIFEEAGAVPADLLFKPASAAKPAQIRLNKDETEDAGYIKIDILSNRGLAQLADLSETPLSGYPRRCPAIEHLFATGNNLGITFAESRGIRKVLMEMKPTSVTDVAMALAVIRPAAAANGHKAEFLEAWRADTWDTDGTRNRILFDDDAIATVRGLLHCSDAEADQWRRVFAKGKQDKQAEFAMLLEREGHPHSYIETTIEHLRQLELYSFCRSHAMSYAQLVWALAYWKATTPYEFWCAALNHCHSEYRGWVHRREARCAGLLLSRSPPPYEIGVRRGEPALLPAGEGRREQPVLLADDHPAQIRADWNKHGVWFGSAFLAGCGLSNYQTTLDGKTRVRFVGLTATGRCVHQSFGDPITMIAIGIANQHYVDVCVKGARGDLLSYAGIAGEGIYTNRRGIETIVAERVRGVPFTQLCGATKHTNGTKAGRLGGAGTG